MEVARPRDQQVQGLGEVAQPPARVGRVVAESLGLLVTGSSDFHGAGKQNRIGENTTAPAVLEAIADQGALEVLG